MQIDVNGLESGVIPKINQGNTYMETAISILETVKIPEDFEHGYKISTVIDNIATIKSEINEIKAWVNAKISSFGSVESKNSTVIGNLLTSMLNANAIATEATKYAGYGQYTGSTTKKRTGASIGNFFKSIGTWWSNKAEKDYEMYAVTEQAHVDTQKRTGASIGNGILGISQGIGSGAEYLFDR